MMKMIKIDNNDLVNDDVRHPQLGSFLWVEDNIPTPGSKCQTKFAT